MYKYRFINFIKRSKSNDITDWTKSIVTLLPKLSDNEETLKESTKLTQHFKIIKDFYDATFYDAFIKFKSSELQSFYEAVHIYEVL